MSSKDFFYGLDENPYPNGYFKRMSIVGETTQNSAKLWFRTGGPGDYIVLLYKVPQHKDERFAAFSHFPFDTTMHQWDQEISFSITDRSDDYTTVVMVENLDPDVLYGYALFSNTNTATGEILLGKKRKHTFRTLPEDLNTPFSFGLYSCHMPYKDKNRFFSDQTPDIRNANLWNFMHDALVTHRNREDLRLRFLIGGGDQVYCDGVESINIWKFLNKKIKKKKDGHPNYPSQEAMLSWFRSIYRGYWNFNPLQQIFANTPTYMMWDDHELCDGFGSYRHDALKEDIGEYAKLLPNLKKRHYTYEESMQVIKDMEWAAKKAYYEYQHSHNPDTSGEKESDDIMKRQWDYSVDQGHTALYFLDGRGNRDFMRPDYKVHGKEQIDRLETWINNMISDESKKFLFISIAVPVFHLKPYVPQLGDRFFGRLLKLQDDLRDSLEHDAHTDERDKLCELLFKAAAHGKKVCILSGDVHMGASYKIRKKETGAVIYQLTSSAITYNVHKYVGKVLGKIVMPEQGYIKGTDYTFERVVTPLPEGNFSIIQIKPDEEKVIFRLYTERYFPGSEDEEGVVAGVSPVINSIQPVELDFQ
jgi:alkaline phosphatase D